MYETVDYMYNVICWHWFSIVLLVSNLISILITSNKYKNLPMPSISFTCNFRKEMKFYFNHFILPYCRELLLVRVCVWVLHNDIILVVIIRRAYITINSWKYFHTHGFPFSLFANYKLACNITIHLVLQRGLQWLTTLGEKIKWKHRNYFVFFFIHFF